MKLRVKGSSLRLRLTRTEVRTLAERGEVEETVQFGAGTTLKYRLARDASNDVISASYGDHLIEIRIPDSLALDWCRRDDVTLSSTQSTGAEVLRIVVEKDFACLAPREDEDESDHFDHPAAGRGKTC